MKHVNLFSSISNRRARGAAKEKKKQTESIASGPMGKQIHLPRCKIYKRMNHENCTSTRRTIKNHCPALQRWY